MNLNQKVTESINIGSVFESLSSGFITVENVLNWLIQNNQSPLSTRYLAAYRALCLYGEPHLQLIDGQHFLTKINNPEYGAIYILSGGTDNLFTDTNEKELNDYLYMVFGRLLTDSSLKDKISSVCDLSCNDTVDIELIIHCRATKLISLALRSLLIDTNNYLKYLVDCDYMSELTKYKMNQLGQLIINRCVFLKTNAPLYWIHVALPLYSKLISEKLLTDQITQPILKQLNDLIPNVIPPDLLTLPLIEYNLKLFTPLIQAYLLGLPIDTYNPNPSMLNSLIKNLLSHGIEHYCQSILHQNQQRLNNHDTFGLPITYEYINTEDTLAENPFMYSPFDIVKFNDGSKIYLFTRPEFKRILETGKNHWTNVPLPLNIITLIEAKQKLARKLHLPESKPLLDLLTDLQNNHFQLDLPESDHNHNDTLLHIFTMFF